MNAEKIQLAIIGGVITSIIGGSIAYAKFIGFNTPESYNNTATVIYDDNEYLLKDLYKLTSDDETHLCIKEHKSHYDMTYGITPKGEIGYMYVIEEDPSIYIDIKTNEEIAIEGYESAFGYNAEKLINYFPYEEYGSVNKVYIQQESVDEIINPKTKTI